jgi:hypothetical protein
MDHAIRILIATPFYQVSGFSPYIRSLAHTIIMLLKETDVDVDFMELSGDSYIDRARNTIAHEFLKTDRTHLVFIDSDMSWNLEGFLRLMIADVDIVGAGYPCKNNWDFYSCALNCHSDGRPIVNENGLISAQGIPTGFMKIRRNVFEKIAEAYPDDYYMIGGEKHHNYFGRMIVNGNNLGEDISFCYRWTQAGGAIWVEPRVTINHYGIEAHTGNYHEYLCKLPGGSDDPAREHRPGNGGIISPSISQEACA